MPETNDRQQSYPYRRRDPRIEEVANILKWITIALILALTFRAFIMEAFRIPTGSMAATLRGEHVFLRCAKCGYKYNVGADYGTIPPQQCPNCEYIIPEGTPVSITHGDRIFVLKCIYQFMEPNRWDVIVFKNPENPEIAYIKRLVAKPGESLEIVDGDIYIDGLIARKPQHVQESLWMPVYDNNFQPYVRNENDNWSWNQPFKNINDSQWILSSKGGSVFILNQDDKIHTIQYDSNQGKKFKARYAYNDINLNLPAPYCHDLKIEFNVSGISGTDLISAVLSHDKTCYTGTVDLHARQMIIEKIENGHSVILEARQLPANTNMMSGTFRFSNVDHQLILTYNSDMLIKQLNREPFNSAEQAMAIPRVQIAGKGNLILSDIKVFRDIYYVSDHIRRATQGEPFLLGEDEYFACGDNSPASLDSRFWSRPGRGNNQQTYRIGVVPKDLLVGKAFFVYWANAYDMTLLDRTLPVIPNVSQFQVIVGGINEAD